MEAVLAILVGLLFASAIYLLLSRALIRIVLGVVILGNAINLMILVAGRLTRTSPPIIPSGRDAAVGAIANPLPQALILTAIVIGFGLFAWLVILAFRAYQALDADNTDHMRLAEPPGEPQPPLDY